ncbi:protein of unknown function [Xenorhabdus doucetiae]|uniref:Uncharacterized protein n=1 Tax=Xenorhabdus doucetiae TaxID=351671 RepID=A0A068QMG1_9GAMM|nr:protein of unknown function [Xenorhabdus doucetiae]
MKTASCVMLFFYLLVLKFINYKSEFFPDICDWCSTIGFLRLNILRE